MARRYSQLSLEERCEVSRLHADGRSIRQIAAAPDRAPSTISRELSRNGGRAGGHGSGRRPRPTAPSSRPAA
ncbi:MAG: helix-turn-helix domain-containing protein [Rhodospirillales bacterium]